MKKNFLIIVISVIVLIIISTIIYFNVKGRNIPIDPQIREMSIYSPNDIYTYGENFVLSVNIIPNNANNEDIIWKSSNPNLVSIDDKGNAKIIGNQDAEVIVTAETKDSKVKTDLKLIIKKIEQIINVKGIELDSQKITLKYGDTIQLKANVIPENATNKNIVWTTSNPELVSIDSLGNIKLNKNEDAEVIITAETEEGRYKKNSELITKKIDKIVKVSKLILDKKEVTLKYKEKIKINAEIIPSNATNKNIEWTSSNPSLVSVDNQGNIEVIDNKNAEVTISAQIEEENYKATVNIITKQTEETIKVTSLEFDKKNYKIEKGETLQLNPIITPNNSTSKTIT